MDVLTGFGALIALIGTGALLAHLGILESGAERVLVDVTFYAATPCLLCMTIARTPLDGHLLGNLVAALTSLIVVGGCYVTTARTFWARSGEESLIGGLSSSYVNAGNLGIAVATYVVGNTAAVVPTLLVQVLCVQPLALAFLERVC